MAIELTKEQFEEPVTYTVQMTHGPGDDFQVNLLDVTKHPRALRAVAESMRKAADLIDEALRPEEVTSQGNDSLNVTAPELSENPTETGQEHQPEPGSTD